MRKCSAKPYDGNEKYIFISYCHRDRAHVFPIIEQLVKDGYRVWYDEGIDPGSEWPEIIARHLNECLVCMAFISENSLNSHNCRREINFALMKKKFFISVMLEPVKMSLGMEMQLSAAQSIFKYGMDSDKHFFNKLYEAKELEGCLGNPDSSVIVSRYEDYINESGAFDKVRDPFSDKWFVNGAEIGGNTVRNSYEEAHRTEEEARRAEEARRQEEARRAEEVHQGETYKAAEEVKRRLEEACRAAEEARRLEEEARRLAEEARQREEEVRRAEEEARKAAEKAERQHREEEARKAAEEAERQRREEEARKAAEEAERRHREEEARKAAEKAERQRREEEARKAAEEAERRRREEEARKAAEEAERRRREEEARRQAKEEDDGERKTIIVEDSTDSEISHMLKREKTNEIIVISKRRFIIGRSESKADYAIMDNRSVSRIHATLSVTEEKCYITDNHSLNKTFVNNRALEPDVPYELKNGDGIKICNEIFMYLRT